VEGLGHSAVASLEAKLTPSGAMLLEGSGIRLHVILFQST
jgi:hypothetical protein